MKLSVRSLFAIRPFTITCFSIMLVLGLFSVGLPILDLIELKSYDVRFAYRGGMEHDSHVVLASVDEKSLGEVGRWPWPRSTIAKMVEKLDADGAKVIGFDIGFIEPDENSELKLLDKLGEEIDSLKISNEELDRFIGSRRRLADNDMILAESIRNSLATVVLGYFFHMDQGELNYRIPQEQIDDQIERIRASKYQMVLYEDPDVEPFVEAYAPQTSLPLLIDAANSCGYYSVRVDSDGVVRWMPMAIKCGQEIYPPLSLMSVWAFLDKPQMVVDVGKYGMEGISIGPGYVPTDENGMFLVNYLGPSETFTHYSATDILNDRLPEGTFRDKIVLVGATALGIFDLRNTPTDPVFPGLEIHANIIDNILTQRFITKPNWTRSFDVAAIVLLSLLAWLLLPRFGAVVSLFTVGTLAALQLFVARYVFVKYGFWLNVVYPMTSLVATSTGLMVHQYLSEERERQKVKKTFQHYVPELVIEQMLENPDKLKMGGEEKELTVLFSDLEGFTGYSEKYKPNEMVNILSDYYANMTELIFEHKGTLKEYVGDELLALYGAPLDLDNHAKLACATALAMRNRRAELQPEWEKMGRPKLRARTGINSGVMLVGNLGSKYRFAYGALGDQVNLGSRLEGLNKMYSTEIIIGENTQKLLDEEFILREMDRVRVKGKTKPVTIFELLETTSNGIDPLMEKTKAAYADALESYYQQQWDEAIVLFKRCLEFQPEDGPAKVMLYRCMQYKETPPQGEWDGVFEHLSK